MSESEQVNSDAAVAWAGAACLVAGTVMLIVPDGLGSLPAGPFLSAAFGIGVALVIKRNIKSGAALIVAVALIPMLWTQWQLRAIAMPQEMATGISAPTSPTLDTPRVDAGNQGPTEEETYAKDSVVIYDLTAKYYETYSDGNVPGVDFKVKNTGSKSLRKVKVTIGFKDKGGTVIAEETYFPVLSGGIMDSEGPLKPGFIRAQERGKFYTAKRVPSEWDGKSVVGYVSEVDFAE